MISTLKSPADSPDGHTLRVERTINAPAEAIFDGFIALYDRQRPAWVTASRLDLRPGGRWSVSFQVPNGPAFREERMITALERPQHLAYDAHILYEDAPDFVTTVNLTIAPVPGGQQVQLVQQGFPTPETRDTFAAAWPDVLEELARRVSTPGREHDPGG